VDPARTARDHDAVGERIQAWAFERYREDMRAAVREITEGGEDVVIGDADLALIASWALNDRELAVGGTPSQRYVEREDLDSRERDVASRIAAARLGLLRVVGVLPDRWIEVENLGIVDAPRMRVMSHEVSRSARVRDVLVGRLMDGPPERSLWGPVGFLNRETGSELRDLLADNVTSLGVSDEPDSVARAMQAASRDITVLLAPGLRKCRVSRRAA
jgi:hypothetical protein